MVHVLGIDRPPSEIVENCVKRVGLCYQHRFGTTEIAACGGLYLRA
jgi:hypothetical protein